MSEHKKSACDKGNDQYREHHCVHPTVTTGKGMAHRDFTKYASIILIEYALIYNEVIDC